MSTQKLNFSKSTLSALVPPPSGRAYYRDERTRGLLLDVYANGTKSFQIYRKVEGKPTRITLGRFNPALPDSREIPNGANPLELVGNSPDLNVRMARKLADAVNASLDVGINPSRDARMARLARSNELTLRQAFDLYYNDYLVPQGKKTAEDMRNDFARYLGKVPPGQKKPRGKEKAKSQGSVDWEDRKLSSITQADVRQLMIQLQEGVGSRTANKTFVLLRSLFNKIIEWGHYSGETPCANVEKFKERSRERFVTGDEVPRFIAELNKVPQQAFKDFVFLSLFTGARRANVLAMRWQDIDFDSGLWTVPEEFSKNGTPLTISITSNARSLLERRRKEQSSTSPYVFPADSKSGHMTAPNKRWKKLLQDAKVVDLRLHDLRRSLGSWAAMTGASLPVIGRALGHKSVQATMVYARLQQDPVTEAMERATSAMMSRAHAASKPGPKREEA